MSFMSEFVEVAQSSELPIGAKKAVLVEGRKILLCHTASGWYASDNSCPHRGGPLAEGDLVRDSITCPWHVWTFDLPSGRNDVNPAISLRKHAVRIDEGRVFVRLTESSEESDVR